jgi:hypothetical protein
MYIYYITYVNTMLPLMLICYAYKMEDNNVGLLPCSDKLAFDTEQHAKTAANVAEYQHGIKLKAYVCKHCKLWHLSSV